MYHLVNYVISVTLPWAPEVFLACGGRLTCLQPQAEATSGEAARKTFHAGHYKDLTETGNRARKVSGTQGTVTWEKPELTNASFIT